VQSSEEHPQPGAHEHETLGARLPELAFGLGGMLATALLVALIPDLRHAFSHALHGDLKGLHKQFNGLGAAGVMLLLALILAHAVLLYPTEIVTATAGFLYGFLPGLALVTVGWLVSALLAYLLGRALGRPFVQAIFGAQRFARLERTVERGGIPLLLAMRLIPAVPFSLTGYVAGAVRVPVWRFTWTTLLGYLPLTAFVAYLGSQAESLSLGDPRLWVGAGVLIALLATARFVNFDRA
jgi:uncharacterized membrane protein YdjX (TVP38/TMEM64 family)